MWSFLKVNLTPDKKTSKKQVKNVKPAMAPTMYMDHDEKNYYIQVELPGVKKEDVTSRFLIKACA